jgi:2-(3-amino-3-carboxypropyl)histidine synthase
MKTALKSFLEEIQRIGEEIKRKDGKLVGVQLPDGLKRLSIQIATVLEAIGLEPIFSGEHSYGACDIDTALLDTVDYLIHAGHTPLYKDDRIFFVPYFVEYNPEIVRKAFSQLDGKICLISTAQYTHRLPQVKHILEEAGFTVELNKGDDRVCFPGQVLGCNYTAVKNCDMILFIGDGLFHPVGAAIYSGKKVCRLNPLSGEVDLVTPENMIKRRYLLMTRCMDMKTCGILLSKKPGQFRLTLAREARNIANDRFHADLIVVDEITPDKIDNLPYDFFVNTACPRITFDDWSNFSKPIISFQELEIIVGKKPWESYSLDWIPG